MQRRIDWQVKNTPKWDFAYSATSYTTSEVVGFQWNCLDTVQLHFSSEKHKKKEEKYEQI